MEQQVRVWGELYRNTLVCVDSCKYGTLQGQFIHPYLEAGEGFRSLSELVLKLEHVMDEMDFPQCAGTDASAGQRDKVTIKNWRVRRFCQKQ